MDELKKLIEAFASSLTEENRKKFLEELSSVDDLSSEKLISIIENYEVDDDEDDEEDAENLGEAFELSTEFVEMLKNMIYNPQSSGDLTSPEHKMLNLGPKVGQEPSQVGQGVVAGAEDVPSEEDEVAAKQNVKIKVGQEESKLKEEVNESMKLIKTHTNGNKTAKVYRNSDTNEHIVKFFTNGKHHEKADYFAGYNNYDKEDKNSSLDDAHMTAKSFVNKNNIKEDITFDFGEDIQKIFEGSEFTDEFRNNAKVILETAIKVKAKDQIEEYKTAIQESVDEYLTSELTSLEESLNENIDRYLTKIVEDWYQDNKLAIDNGLKVEIAESLFSEIKNVITLHDIVIPDSSENIVESLQDEKDEISEMYKQEVDKNIELTKKINDIEKSVIVSGLTEGMIDNDAEKLVSLCEEVPYDSKNKEEFIAKAKLLKEHVSKGISKDSIKIGKTLTEEFDEEVTDEKVVSKDVEVVLEKLRKII